MKTCTRFFTQDQIDEIRLRLATIAGAKDTQFELARQPLEGQEEVAIIQDGRNKRISISDMFDQYSSGEGGTSITIDGSPTQNSPNAVASGGVWQAIQDMKNDILTDTCFLKVKSDSVMCGSLVNGPSHTNQTQYNQYCQLVWDALTAGKLIILDDDIGYIDDYDPSNNRFTITFFTTDFTVVWDAIKEGDNWTWIQNSSMTRGGLATKEYISSLLGTYYNKTEVNTIETNLRNYVNSLRGSIINDVFNSDDFTSRPRYVKANWLEDEVRDGIRATTIDSTLPKAVKRWETLWEAARHCRVTSSSNIVSSRVPTIKYGVSEGIQRLVIMYGIPAVYAWTNDADSPKNATQILVKFFDGDKITIYTIDKVQSSDSVVDYQDCYLRIGKSESLVPITNVDGVYYNMSYSLTSCTCNNMVDKVRGSYDAILTVNPWDEITQVNYVFNNESVVVTMGGTDITSSVVSAADSQMTSVYIHIPNVTGNVTITAVAVDSERE